MSVIFNTKARVWIDFLIVIYSIFFLYIAFSFKRFSRIMFLKGRNEIIQERQRRLTINQQIEERITRQQEMTGMTLQAGENKRLIQKEREQLTGINVYVHYSDKSLSHSVLR